MQNEQIFFQFIVMGMYGRFWNEKVCNERFMKNTFFQNEMVCWLTVPDIDLFDADTEKILILLSNSSDFS